MNIVLLGGAGFAGCQLGYYLYKKGHNIKIIDDLSFGNKDNLIINNEVFGEFIFDDIRNPNIINYLKDTDVVINFAAIAPLPVNQIDPSRSFSVNVAGWANVLEACRKAKIPKIIFASTSAVYENNEKYPFTENDVVGPHLTYSLTKKHAEELALSYVKLYGMDITIPRFFNLYGPHHDHRRKSPPLIAYIMKCMMLGEIPVLHSDGQQKRDYVYIEDVCRICEMIIENPKSKGQIFNVSSNSTISMNEIYEEIKKLFGSNINAIFRDPSLLWDNYPELSEGFALDPYFIAKETNKFSQGTYDKAKKILGWEPEYSFKDGIKLTVDYTKKIGF